MDALILILLMVVVVVVAIKSILRAGQESHEEESAAQAVSSKSVDAATSELERYVEILCETNAFPFIDNHKLALERGEFVALISDTTMFEYRTSRLTKGIGTTVRIVGIPLRIGFSHGHPRDELREVARGTLHLTNQRLVFVGDRRTYTARIDHILQFVAHTADIVVQNTRRERPVLFTVSNGLLWSGVHRLLHKLQPLTPALGPRAQSTLAQMSGVTADEGTDTTAGKYTYTILGNRPPRG